MDRDSTKLRKHLREAGFSERIVSAAWPHWWNDEVSGSPSARAELRFALARKLGLQPQALMGERVEFVWKDKARFKNLGTETASERHVLSSFAVSVGRSLTRATTAGQGFRGLSAERLRAHILASSQYVTLPTLVAACWAAGVPVVHLRIFPLATKAMHAMVVGEASTGAIMLGRDAGYPASIAFTLAHEIGHLALGHVQPGDALVDVEDPATSDRGDAEEREADAYALTLLTGSTDPDITTSLGAYNAPTLADAVMRAGPQARIDPGTLALCVGYRQRNWAVVMAALRLMQPERVEIWRAVNGMARREIEWDHLGDDEQDFLRTLLDLDDE